MTDEQLPPEIRDANLACRLLAQNLKIDSSAMLLWRFRVDDDMVWNLLTNHTASKINNDATTKRHASILMAGRFAEAM